MKGHRSFRFFVLTVVCVLFFFIADQGLVHCQTNDTTAEQDSSQAGFSDADAGNNDTDSNITTDGFNSTDDSTGYADDGNSVSSDSDATATEESGNATASDFDSASQLAGNDYQENQTSSEYGFTSDSDTPQADNETSSESGFIGGSGAGTLEAENETSSEYGFTQTDFSQADNETSTENGATADTDNATDTEIGLGDDKASAGSSFTTQSVDTDQDGEATLNESEPAQTDEDTALFWDTADTSDSASNTTEQGGETGSPAGLENTDGETTVEGGLTDANDTEEETTSEDPGANDTTDDSWRDTGVDDDNNNATMTEDDVPEPSTVVVDDESSSIGDSNTTTTDEEEVVPSTVEVFDESEAFQNESEAFQNDSETFQKDSDASQSDTEVPVYETGEHDEHTFNETTEDSSTITSLEPETTTEGENTAQPVDQEKESKETIVERKPEKADFIVYNDDNKPCLLASINITIWFKYHIQEGLIRETYTVSQKDEKDESSYVGSCGDRVSFLSITWNNHTFTLNLTFALEDRAVEERTAEDGLEMDVLPEGVNSTSSWALSQVALNYDTTNQQFFPGASNPSVKSVDPAQVNLFKTPLGLSYLCESPGAVRLMFKDVEMVFNYVRLEPFQPQSVFFANETVECSGDMSELPMNAESTTVPLVVAACLAAAVIVIIIGYAIHRCLTRHRHGEYKPMD